MEKFFISRPIFAISLAIVIVLVGLISILNLPIEQYPDITPPVVEVSATYDGADAETVNNRVRSRPRRHLHPEQRILGRSPASGDGDQAGRHHAQDHDGFPAGLLAAQRRTLRRRIPLELCLHQPSERTAEDQRRGQGLDHGRRRVRHARMAPARRAEILRHPGFGRHRRHRKSGRHLPCRTVRSRTSARRHLLYLYGDHAPADHHGRAVRRHRRRDHL